MLFYLQPPLLFIRTSRACGRALKALTGGGQDFSGALSVLSGIFKVLLSYTQCLSTMTRFNQVSWPRIFIDFMDALGELLPEVFTLLPAECIAGERLGFYFELYSTLALPLFIFGFALIIVLFARTVSYFLHYGTAADVDSLFMNDEGVDLLLATRYVTGDSETKVTLRKRDALQKSVMIALRHPRFQNVVIFSMLFLYPMLCRKSIAVFDCVAAGADEDGVPVFLLRDDPVLQCYNQTWFGAALVATLVGILFYAFGCPFIASFITQYYKNRDKEERAEEKARLEARDAVIRRTKKMDRTSMLAAVYKPKYWYCEPIGLLHNFFFTGVIHICWPEERLQIWIGVFVSLMTYIAFLATTPYKHPIVTKVQAAALLQILLTYITAFLFFRDPATGRDETGAAMSEDDSMGIVLVSINCLCFVVIGLASIYSMNEALNAQGRLMILKVKVDLRATLKARLMSSKGRAPGREAFKAREKVISRAPIKDRYLLALNPSQLEAIGGDGSKTFHLFLSHVWTTAQDQCRLLKKRLQHLVPVMRIFLDVDDLVEGKGADDIDKSSVCLVYCSDGYFTSKNCIRELLRAVILDRPVITIIELDRNRWKNLNTTKKHTWSDELLGELIKNAQGLTPVQHEALRMLQRAQTARRWRQLRSRAHEESQKMVRAIRDMARGKQNADPLLTEIKEEIHRQLTDAQKQYQWWDLPNEVAEWLQDPDLEHKVTPKADGSKKSAKACNVFDVEVLYQKLFENDPITWERYTEFQDVMLHEIANRMLTPKYRPSAAPSNRPSLPMSGTGLASPNKLEVRPEFQRSLNEFRTRVNGTEQKDKVPLPSLLPRKVARHNEWRRTLNYHLFCSAGNEGAYELARELNRWWARSPGIQSFIGEGPLSIIHSKDMKEKEATVKLSQSASMLLLLNSKVWVDKEQRQILAQDVCSAMELGVRIILAHEMPGADKQASERKACDFGIYFSVDRGKHRTPKFLKEEGIYNSIATPMKGDAFRNASLILLAREVAQYRRVQKKEGVQANFEAEFHTSADEAAEGETNNRAVCGLLEAAGCVPSQRGTWIPTSWKPPKPPLSSRATSNDLADALRARAMVHKPPSCPPDAHRTAPLMTGAASTSNTPASATAPSTALDVAQPKPSPLTALMIGVRKQGDVDTTDEIPGTLMRRKTGDIPPPPACLGKPREAGRRDASAVGRSSNRLTRTPRPPPRVGPPPPGGMRSAPSLTAVDEDEEHVKPNQKPMVTFEQHPVEVVQEANEETRQRETGHVPVVEGTEAPEASLAPVEATVLQGQAAEQHGSNDMAPPSLEQAAAPPPIGMDALEEVPAPIVITAVDELPAPPVEAPPVVPVRARAGGRQGNRRARPLSRIRRLDDAEDG